MNKSRRERLTTAKAAIEKAKVILENVRMKLKT